ncbi:MAG: amino acid ABC transporter ATP-binding protein [Solobacterium sp.]|nr:amino acid ABC transporter ATP-binding protein [Solobacterium sp.]MDD5982184.1 amino acid ABC transporter ATP-binding protein [Solobacterium sp.]MDD6121840.1 amino acid ABC transporter ATP-binding protein [Solobacterium sp.]MDD6497123.1 amino acid ABC transporter ATP-binding protein [Solobacterium sp.]MDD6886290.1 amino acid ABC transporter ATP-binding protein [Solobacterium sp.]
MIELRNLRKSFDSLEVLKDINLKIDKGDVISILGSSGSGKTTCLRCMNFLEKSDGGTLVFDGQEYDLAHISKKDIATIRRKTAFVFQNYNLFLNKTVLENVMEALTVVRKVDKQSAKNKAIEVLEKVGMGDKLDYYPSKLSGGQQQRVSIARALAYDPEVIYFDEPTSALDPELIGEVLSVMRDLAKSGITMVVVTHEMNFARNVSTKVVFMENGEIIKCAAPDDFFEHQDDERIKQFIRKVGE